MPVKKGIERKRARGALRQLIWNSMRIHHRGFTIPDILMSTPGATEKNIKNILQLLTTHGLAVKCPGFVSGRAGVRQKWQLTEDKLFAFPIICPNCGEGLTAGFCDPETKKERQRKKQTIGVGRLEREMARPESKYNRTEPKKKKKDGWRPPAAGPRPAKGKAQGVTDDAA
jgi:hypothetical protein